MGQRAKRRRKDMLVDSPHIVVGQMSKTKTPTELALAHYDHAYKKHFGDAWHSMRLAMLSRPKHCALVNNFGAADETRAKLAAMGCLSVREIFLRREREIAAAAKVGGVGGGSSSLSDAEGKIGASSVTAVAEGDARADADQTEANGSPHRPPRPLPADPREPPSDADALAAAAAHVSMRHDAADVAARIIGPDEMAVGDTEKATMALHDFVPTTRLKGMDDFVEEAEYYESYEKVAASVPIEIRKETSLHFPKHLDAFVYPRGSLDRFPPPAPSAAGLGKTNYFCYDLASFVAVLALGVQPNDEVLDMCSGPGGKSLTLLQTLYPARLVCNDIKSDRLRRVMNVVDQYIGDVGGVKQSVVFKRRNAAGFHVVFPNTFDKVLCDVPCFTDRVSLAEDDNNIFNVTRVKERIKMPEGQAEMLKSALQCLKPGGSVLYSTCTLSPVQNDGVVHAALKSCWEETRIEFNVRDLSRALDPLRGSVLNFAGGGDRIGGGGGGGRGAPKYGSLVVPHVALNFGPMYFAKIQRTA